MYQPLVVASLGVPGKILDDASWRSITETDGVHGELGVHDSAKQGQTEEG